MIGIIITGHGSYPEGMYESIRLIAGDVEGLKTVPFHESQEQLEHDLIAAMAEVEYGSGVVCFADLAGGTPFNVSSKIAASKGNVRVIGGTNSPMLLSSLFQREQNLDDFVQHALYEGQTNIKSFEIAKKNKEEDLDGI
ncbi:PTS sugar transporter subunit IIA [Virgibacillus sp. Bac330]|uniref:PTS sugar transporter subunit IIA n=1 Tax=Virgibacillus sp. Bac330 TaxID=2419841 RepID=UPI000EF43E2D|nr:PTS sugar transporter subunit IIA [Virgibacillus sp. Bac330]